jgi:hypothetical protein
MKRLIRWWHNRRTLDDIEAEMLTDVSTTQWEIEHGYMEVK